MRAQYPGAQLSDISMRAYWEELSDYPRDIVHSGCKAARRESLGWFPPAPLIANKCSEILSEIKAKEERESNQYNSRPALPDGYREEWAKGASLVLYLMERKEKVDFGCIDGYESLVALAKKHGYKFDDKN